MGKSQGRFLQTQFGFAHHPTLIVHFVSYDDKPCSCRGKSVHLRAI